MENLKQECEDVLVRFNEYKKLTDDKISKLKAENKKLGKSLAVFFNIVEISGYVNSFISKDNLMVLINDMIIGVLGATNSTIYIRERDKFAVKASNNADIIGSEGNRCLEYMENGQPCIINLDSTEVTSYDIHSILGIPICFGSVNIGYIVAEHTLYNFFDDEHKIFLGTIANQIAIAIENARLYKEIQIAAEIDPLLGVYNRRTFFSIVESKLKAEHNKAYAIVMMDFDNFKNINDTLGHQFGDEVLIQTTDIIKILLLDDDIVARYGGEELIIYMNTVNSAEEIYQRVDSIRSAIENNNITIDNKTINVTASFGISFSNEVIKTLASNIQVADKLLYKAKYSGKNRIVTSKF